MGKLLLTMGQAATLSVAMTVLGITYRDGIVRYLLFIACMFMFVMCGATRDAMLERELHEERYHAESRGEPPDVA